MHTKQAGFTLIELVTVIILLGILAVTIAPKFTGSASFEAHSYRIQLISALRLTQQRAMQHTSGTQRNNDDYCNQLVITNRQYGVPDRTDCSKITFDSTWQPDATGLVVESNHSVNFLVENKSPPVIIRFDSLGRPIDISGTTNDCAKGCIIQIKSSVETLSIKIESQGFIHASN